MALSSYLEPRATLPTAGPGSYSSDCRITRSTSFSFYRQVSRIARQEREGVAHLDAIFASALRTRAWSPLPFGYLRLKLYRKAPYINTWFVYSPFKADEIPLSTLDYNSRHL